MKTKISIYRNRYGDQITFEQKSESRIDMTGYSQYLRVGYPNNYEAAYSAYKADCAKLEEPDMDLLTEDVSQNRLRELTLKEFKELVHNWEIEKNPLAKYRSLIVSDTTQCDMVDPSGGPYISVGTDLGEFFSGSIGKKYVSKIQFKSDLRISFTVTDKPIEE